MTTNKNWAANYAAEMKWSVFPLHFIINGNCSCNKQNCRSKGKHPLTRDGFMSATKDEDQIDSWWNDHPDANIGIATGKRSNLIVVDIDEDKGGKFSDLLKICSEQELDTVIVKTGGGRHLYFECPLSEEIRNSAGNIAPNIDIRGEGGYVVAPPSLHYSGTRYEWLKRERILPFPKSLLDKLNGRIDTIVSSDNGLIIPAFKEKLKVPEIVPDGARNETLTRIAGSLRSLGLNQLEMEVALVELNSRICTPPMDDSEVRQITNSVARYETKELREPISDETEVREDYQNTLRPYTFEQFRNKAFEKKEIIGLHIGRRDVAMVAGATNAGKSTFLRNLLLCMACGRPFPPFVPEQDPVKCLLIDFESDAEDLQPDLIQMSEILTPQEKRLVDENLIVLPKGLVNGQLFQLNRHWEFVTELIKSNSIEFLAIDNVSSAFDLNDENSNSEVARKVLKPLLTLAYSTNVATCFAHHFGKANQKEKGVYAGRGASQFQSLSKTVVNITGNVSEREMVKIACKKRKSDGGTNYTETFKLNTDTRWFEPTDAKIEQEKEFSLIKQIEYLVSIYIEPEFITFGEICENFKEVTSKTVQRNLRILRTEWGTIKKLGNGKYCRNVLRPED